MKVWPTKKSRDRLRVRKVDFESESQCGQLYRWLAWIVLMSSL